MTVVTAGLPPVITVENPEHRLIETVFLPAKLQDNKILMERDPQYKERLFQQGEELARALLEGDWSTFVGKFLTEFSYQRHTVEDFEIPKHWTRWRGYDWGFAAPACMLWLARDPATRRLYVYRELYEAGLNDPQQAEKINDMTESYEKFAFNFADPSVWTKRTIGLIAKSTYDIFIEHQILLTKADNKSESKARKLRSALGDIHDGKPGLQIFRTCKMTIAELEGLMSDPDRPEVPLANQADHAYDALCYALTHYTPPRLVDGSKTAVRQSPLVGLKGL